MNKIRLHIRGQMGVQILQTFVALSRLQPDETPVIYVNTKGLGPNFHNRLHDVFMPQFETLEQDEIRKTPYWETGCAASVFKTRDHTLNVWMLPKPISFSTVFPEIILHCRGGDKPVATAESIVSLYRDASAHLTDQRTVRIISDDENLAKAVANEIPGAKYNVDTAINDWQRMLTAESIIAMPSAYVSSILMCNPNKDIIFGGPTYCDGGYPASHGDLLFLSEAAEFCPNLKIYG